MTHVRPTSGRIQCKLAAAALAAAVLAGCGSGSGGDQPAPTAAAPTELAGRPIGAEPTEAGRAVAAATRFAGSLLRLHAGAITARQIEGIDARLRESLGRLRVPPAQADRRARVLRATADRVDARSARVTVTVLNEDEGLTYPLPIDLEHRDAGWVVLSAGDDE